MEIVRFGVGHRRPNGPPGSVGVTGQVIHSDDRGVISELAFARSARVEAHSNPNVTWFVVIEGGGWTRVGDEESRVAAGDAVLWPPDVVHAAWTEHGPMRAFVVEFAAGSAAADGGRVLEGRGVRLLAGDASRADRGEGALRHDAPAAYDPTEGEPR
ncbi:MAG TPA: cupin domain-containing protein [Candidatus Limnocylindrales bacterium]|nr:cupin domain-containing protein [Candidatus Limnocylindrales bacterium]